MPDVNLPEVVCSVTVFDAWDSYATANTTILIYPSTQSITEVQADLTRQLQQSAISVDAQKNVLALVSTTLNRVNCTLSPNCTQLNRLPCQDTAHSCGKCMAGFREAQMILIVPVGENQPACFF